MITGDPRIKKTPRFDQTLNFLARLLTQGLVFLNGGWTGGLAKPNLLGGVRALVVSDPGGLTMWVSNPLSASGFEICRHFQTRGCQCSAPHGAQPGGNPQSIV